MQRTLNQRYFIHLFLMKANIHKEKTNHFAVFLARPELLFSGGVYFSKEGRVLIGGMLLPSPDAGYI